MNRSEGKSGGFKENRRSISRRRFVVDSLAAGVCGATSALVTLPPLLRSIPISSLGFSEYDLRNRIQGGIVGAPALRGHLPRTFQGGERIHNSIRTGIAIIGGGAAGLSTGWELSRKGFNDYLILELDSMVGGNSIGGSIQGLRHPWGAHYLPIPNKESFLVRELLSDLGEIKNYGENERRESAPIFKEESLVAAPAERLFHYGRWHPGIVPTFGESAGALDQHRRFHDAMEEFTSAQGSDGRPAFAIPIEHSSSDERFTTLDTYSFSDWLRTNKYSTPSLLWYLNYCCKDDYGATIDQVSAWAGIHYFAGRRGWSGNAENSELLTWPNGNQYLVEGLAKFSSQRILSDAVVLQVKEIQNGTGGSFSIIFYNCRTSECTEVLAHSVVLATPLHTHRYLLKDDSVRGAYYDSPLLLHHPWMVANMLVEGMPEGEWGESAWDNVLFGSDSLGYVNATHQLHSLKEERSLLTYYLPCPTMDPSQKRAQLLTTPWVEWVKMVCADLHRPHPSLYSHLSHFDVWLWGHGMAAPAPGYLWGQNGRPRDAETPVPGLYRAHTDLSGISIFEEAQYRGVRAAQQARAWVEGRVRSV